jgi:hypothetical protein
LPDIEAERGEVLSVRKAQKIDEKSDGKRIVVLKSDKSKLNFR